MHDPSGKKYVTQLGETVAGSSDEEARMNAHIRAKELTKKNKSGNRYEVADFKKTKTHHIVTRLPI